MSCIRSPPGHCHFPLPGRCSSRFWMPGADAARTLPGPRRCFTSALHSRPQPVADSTGRTWNGRRNLPAGRRPVPKADSGRRPVKSGTGRGSRVAHKRGMDGMPQRRPQGCRRRRLRSGVPFWGTRRSVCPGSQQAACSVRLQAGWSAGKRFPGSRSTGQRVEACVPGQAHKPGLTSRRHPGFALRLRPSCPQSSASPVPGPSLADTRFPAPRRHRVGGGSYLSRH